MLVLKLRKFIDFMMVAGRFPSTVKILLRSSRIHGLSSYIDKAFLYIMAKGISTRGDILEIGSYKGSSALLLAAGNESSPSKSNVWLVEPCFQPTREAFLDNFKKYGLDGNLILVEKPSKDARKQIDTRFRLIFVDGLHEYDDVKNDILLWKDSLADGGVIAFHDIQLEGVVQAVNEFIIPSADLKVHGVVGGILYASKGPLEGFRFPLSLKKFHSFHGFREQVISFGKMLGLYKY